MIRNHYKILLFVALSGSSFHFVASSDATPPAPHHETILLHSDILATMDGKGIGINGETISLIKKYQSDIMNMIRGKRNAAGVREGMFEYQGKKYSVAALKEFEDKGLLSQHDRQTLIKKMRDVFEATSLEFKPVAHGTKPIMSILIIESCHLRNRSESLLVAWSKTKEHDEEELFNKHISSIKDFEMFLIDLYNYLTDMCNSCPKAMAQFKDRVERFSRIKALLPTLNISKDKESSFMKFATKALEHDHVHPGEITEQKIQELYNAFKTS